MGVLCGGLIIKEESLLFGECKFYREAIIVSFGYVGLR